MFDKISRSPNITHKRKNKERDYVSQMLNLTVKWRICFYQTVDLADDSDPEAPENITRHLNKV